MDCPTCEQPVPAVRTKAGLRHCEEHGERHTVVVVVERMGDAGWEIVDYSEVCRPEEGDGPYRGPRPK